MNRNLLTRNLATASASTVYITVITLLYISIMLIPAHYREVLYFDLTQAMEGQYWRFVTGHFTHFSWEHCGLNIAAVIMLFKLLRPVDNTTHWIIATSIIMLTVSSGLMISSVKMDWYVGLSGVVTGLYVYACIKTYLNNALLSTALLLIIATYVLNQLLFGGELVMSALSEDIITSSHAHAYGFAGGLLCSVIFFIRNFDIDYGNIKLS